MRDMELLVDMEGTLQEVGVMGVMVVMAGQEETVGTGVMVVMVVFLGGMEVMEEMVDRRILFFNKIKKKREIKDEK
jgi:hypothetical protein